LNQVKKTNGPDAVLMRSIAGILVADSAYNDDSGLVPMPVSRSPIALNGSAGNTAIPLAQGSGTVILNNSQAGAYTIAAPVAGAVQVTMVPPNNHEVFTGGNDGTRLRIVSSSAFAHTVTGPLNSINGVGSTLTFAAAAGNAVELEAYNGVWYTVNTKGVTVS
jgi:hypothetical protein